MCAIKDKLLRQPYLDKLRKKVLLVAHINKENNKITERLERHNENEIAALQILNKSNKNYQMHQILMKKRQLLGENVIKLSNKHTNYQNQSY